MSDIDTSKLISELRNWAHSYSCQTIDGSNRDFDLTAARVIRAIANSLAVSIRLTPDERIQQEDG